MFVPATVLNIVATPYQHFVVNQLANNPKKDAIFKLDQLTQGEIKEIDDLVAQKILVRIDGGVILVAQ